MSQKENKKCTIRYQCPYSGYYIEIDCSVYLNGKESYIKNIIDEECAKFINNKEEEDMDRYDNKNNNNIYY